MAARRPRLPSPEPQSTRESEALAAAIVAASAAVTTVPLRTIRSPLAMDLRTGSTSSLTAARRRSLCSASKKASSAAKAATSRDASSATGLATRLAAISWSIAAPRLLIVTRRPAGISSEVNLPSSRRRSST